MLYKIGEIKSPRWDGGGEVEWMLRFQFGSAFRSDAAFDGFGNRQFPSAAAAATFMMHVNHVGQSDDFARGFESERGAVNVTPEKSERFGTGSVWGDAGFSGFGVDELPVAPDESEVSKIVFIVGPVQEGNEVRSFRIGLAHLEGEAGAGALAGDGKSSVPGEDELFGVDHGGGYTPRREGCQE